VLWDPIGVFCRRPPGALGRIKGFPDGGQTPFWSGIGDSISPGLGGISLQPKRLGVKPLANRVRSRGGKFEKVLLKGNHPKGWLRGFLGRKGLTEGLGGWVVELWLKGGVHGFFGGEGVNPKDSEGLVGLTLVTKGGVNGSLGMKGV